VHPYPDEIEVGATGDGFDRDPPDPTRRPADDAEGIRHRDRGREKVIAQ
jgi:hypothetical protein